MNRRHAMDRSLAVLVASVAAAWSSMSVAFQCDREPEHRNELRLSKPMRRARLTSMYLATHRSIHTDSPERKCSSFRILRLTRHGALPLLSSESLYRGMTHFLWQAVVILWFGKSNGRDGGESLCKRKRSWVPLVQILHHLDFQFEFTSWLRLFETLTSGHPASSSVFLSIWMKRTRDRLRELLCFCSPYLIILFPDVCFLYTLESKKGRTNFREHTDTRAQKHKKKRNKNICICSHE